MSFVEDTESIENNMETPLQGCQMLVSIFVFLIFYNSGNTIDYSTSVFHVNQTITLNTDPVQVSFYPVGLYLSLISKQFLAFFEKNPQLKQKIHCAPHHLNFYHYPGNNSCQDLPHRYYYIPQYHVCVVMSVRLWNFKDGGS